MGIQLTSDIYLIRLDWPPASPLYALCVRRYISSPRLGVATSYMYEERCETRTGLNLISLRKRKLQAAPKPPLFAFLCLTDVYVGEH